MKFRIQKRHLKNLKSEKSNGNFNQINNIFKRTGKFLHYNYDMMIDEEMVKQVNKKIKAKKEFYIHLGVFAVSILFLFMLNLLVSPGFLWVLIAAGGWLIGIVAHYLTVFGIPHPQGENWEEEEYEKEMLKLKAQKARKEDADTLDLQDRPTLKDYQMERLDYDEDEFV